MTPSSRRVTAELVLQVHQPLQVMLQVAVAASPGPAQPPADGAVAETLQVCLDAQPLQAREVHVDGGNRIHLINPSPGRLTVSYSAIITGQLITPAVTEAERITYLRPSRYAQSDRLAPIAQAEFGGVVGAADRLAAVSSWTGTQLSYVPGSSGPTDGAIDTLLNRQGVCRDYAHLVIALLRALDVPARLAAVYAPGLNPMDFHAVAEAAIGDQWRVVDATLLAPRSSLVRIATGRDSADTAFLSAYGGAADLLESYVSAVTNGPLPSDDVIDLVSIS